MAPTSGDRGGQGWDRGRALVAQKLALEWSPKQIAGWLERQFPADHGMQISHETIYRSLFVQTRGMLKKELMVQLRTAQQMRQAKGGAMKNGLGQIVDAVSIRARPAEVEDRAVPRHWEGGLLCGANNTHIATRVERHTRFVMLLKVTSKDTATVAAALAKHVRKLPQQIGATNSPHMTLVPARVGSQLRKILKWRFALFQEPSLRFPAQ